MSIKAAFLLIGLVVSCFGFCPKNYDDGTSHNNAMMFIPNTFSQENYFYIVEKIISKESTHVEMILRLNRESKNCFSNNYVFQKVKVVIDGNSFNELSFRITDLEGQIFELPHTEPFPHSKEKNWEKQTEYLFKHANQDERFYFCVYRNSSKEIVFDTRQFPLIFTDKYLEITTQMNGEQIYGLGDRRYTSFELNTGEFSFWNADATRIDHGKPGQQIYGHHPMYLRKETESTNFHVVLLRNTYGMQVQYVKNNRLTYKIIGGIFDFRFFFGDKYPETAIKLYHHYVNGYTLHPFWVQGYHQSRWGYNSTEKVKKVFDTFNALSIPIDSLWSDIDYMDNFKDFTFDKNKLDLSVFRNIFNLSNPAGLHWSSIIDVGISVDSDAGRRGIEQKVFIKSKITQRPLIGWVWPGKTYFPDFNHPNASNFWYDGLNNITLNYGLKQSGIWLDMNEFANFVTGEISGYSGSNPSPKYPFNPCGDDNPMESGTISLSALHYSGKDALIYIPNYQITQYDMHNLNGFTEGYSTYLAAKRMGHKLPFILSRSTLFGSGKYVQHWTGDNMSTWEYLRLSIGLIQNFQMFGIPLVGADICGFNGDTNPELCARWNQVGSLYPFSRNHNSINNIDQEPYAFEKYPYVLSSVKKVLQIRYQLLKFYYHLFVRGGGIGTVFRPLFFEFPEDKKAYQYEGQFMLGEYLMAAPVMSPGNQLKNSTHHVVYFPKNAIFYDFYNYSLQKQGINKYQIPFDHPCPLFIQSGKIVHIQDGKTVLRSRELVEPFTLLIALNKTQSATGQIMSISNYDLDDNVVDLCVDKNCLLNIEAQVFHQKGKEFILFLSFSASTEQTVYQNIQVRKIVIIGLNFNEEIFSKVILLQENYLIKSNRITFLEGFTL